jgi:hypothetical protein
VSACARVPVHDLADSGTESFEGGAIVTNTRTPVIRTLPSDIRCVLSG